MRRKSYVLVFDGLADWEPAHALCEICKSGKYDVVAVGFSDDPVTTMGGLRVLPDITLDAVNPADAAIFIMPGGDMWEQKSNEEVISVLRQLHSAGVPIAAICGATLEVARAKLTRNVRHTSNAKVYLKELVGGYGDEEFYVDELAVSDNNIITASGLGGVEFGREIIRQLDIYSEADTKVWFEMFKHGVYPSPAE
ncbi:MAG TPA: type 1 glutamine amidotransferase family protein [Pyrinomonadaceae bacterium]|jgi:putative intracellular protease/amidase|nr:type 1 glutamine amidotransferase family protein [Pyrinomonadaceae bacterium]